MDPAHTRVQEMQGLYGPFTIAERVVQKIWLRRDFDHREVRLLDGRPLLVRTPGAWNLLGGPDFRDARLTVDGAPASGDIEVHFHLSDWRAHGHAHDRAYGNVVLHVVLFPPVAGEPSARRVDGAEIPTLVLLPLLHRSLEEHASDDALEGITARDAAERIAELAALPHGNVVELLHRHAALRWKMKQRFAALRLEKLGWTDAAHHTALEILGYRHNRAAMLTAASMHALSEWGGGLDPQAIFEERRDHWQTQGVRPANHPRLRLRQYAGWCSQRPAWPAELAGIIPLGNEGFGARMDTSAFRRHADLGAMREDLALQLAAGTVGGSRFDTLVCDGFLPLVAAAGGREMGPWWFHWFMGDVPEEVRGALAMLGVAGRGAPPFCHGLAQGLLGWMAERDLRASG